MELSVSSNTISTIIAVVAPGYFAIQAYSVRYAKADKDFSRLLVEYIAYGSFIVGIYNFVLTRILYISSGNVLSVRYFLPLLVISYLLGWLVSIIRSTKPVVSLAQRLKLPDPDNDFLRVEFKKLDAQAYVTVALKNGVVFSGTPERSSAYNGNGAQRLCFNNVAWYNEKRRGKRVWEERSGSIIISTADILYIETGTPPVKT